MIMLSGCSKTPEEKSNSPTVEKVKVTVQIVPSGLQPIGDDIFKSFDIILSRDESRKPESVFRSTEGILTDRTGKIVMNFEGSPPFYGYRAKLIVDETTGEPQELLLNPLFGDGTNVGDSITLEWNDATQTFEKAFANIP